jgi:NAD+ kinase
MKVAVIPNLDKDGAQKCTADVIKILNNTGDEAYIHESLSELFPTAKTVSHHYGLADACDVIVTIGGDGTILHAAKHAAAFNKPILGINMGRVGYLAGIEPNKIDLLPEVIRGSGAIEERKMLACSVNGEPMPYLALNDGAISGQLNKAYDYTVDINGSGNYLHRADGIIISTPTGSTAYSLAAGGPIVDPTLNCMIFTPVCPLQLSDRSVIYGGDNEITIKLKDRDHGKFWLTLDGNKPIEIDENDVVSFSVAKQSIKLIKMGKMSFYDVVSRKLIR